MGSSNPRVPIWPNKMSIYLGSGLGSAVAVEERVKMTRQRISMARITLEKYIIQFSMNQWPKNMDISLSDHIQGVFFNWYPPKNHKYGKKLKYQNWYPPKIHKYGAAQKVIDFQEIEWIHVFVSKNRYWFSNAMILEPLLQPIQAPKDSLIKGTTLDPAPYHTESRLPAQLSSLKPQHGGLWLNLIKFFLFCT